MDLTRACVCVHAWVRKSVRHIWYARAYMRVCMYINNISVCVCIVYVCVTIRFFTVGDMQLHYVYLWSVYIYTVYGKTFAVHQAVANMYCTQQVIQGENFRDRLKNRKKRESFPTRKFSRIRYVTPRV